MAFATVFSFNDAGNGGVLVTYEVDETNDGGAGTVGRHRLTQGAEVGEIFPAAIPARTSEYIAYSDERMSQWIGYGNPRNLPSVHRIIEVTP